MEGVGGKREPQASRADGEIAGRGFETQAVLSLHLSISFTLCCCFASGKCPQKTPWGRTRDWGRGLSGSSSWQLLPLFPRTAAPLRLGDTSSRACCKLGTSLKSLILSLKLMQVVHYAS